MVHPFGLAQPKGAGHFLEEVARCLLQRLGRLQLFAAHLAVNQRQHQNVQVRRGFVMVNDCRQQVFIAIALASPSNSRSKECIFSHARTGRQTHQQLKGLDIIAAQFDHVNTRSGHRTMRQGSNFGGRVGAAQDAVLSGATGVDMRSCATLVLVSAQVVCGGLGQR